MEYKNEFYLFKGNLHRIFCLWWLVIVITVALDLLYKLLGYFGNRSIFECITNSLLGVSMAYGLYVSAWAAVCFCIWLRRKQVEGDIPEPSEWTQFLKRRGFSFEVFRQEYMGKPTDPEPIPEFGDLMAIKRGAFGYGPFLKIIRVWESDYNRFRFVCELEDRTVVCYRGSEGKWILKKK